MKAKPRIRLIAATAVRGAFSMAWRDESAIGQTSSVKTEYLMTIYLDIKPIFTNDTLRVVDIPSGWVDGSAYQGENHTTIR